MDQPQHAYTLSQLSKLSGVKPRTLQYWSANSVLEPVATTKMKGTGVDRYWPQIELEIAAVLGVLERWGITIGTLHGIAATVRSWKRVAEDQFDIKSPEQLRRFVKEHAFRSSIKASRIAPEELATKLGLKEPPSGENIIDLSSADGFATWNNLQNWLEWQNAKDPRQEVFMRIAVSADGTWQFDLPSGDRGYPLNWREENDYHVLKLSNILRGL